MATKKNNTTSPPPRAMSASAALALAPQATLLPDRVETEEQAAIVEQTQTELVRLRAYGAKKEYGQQIVMRGAVNSVQTYVRYVETDRSLRNRVQSNEYDQADINQFADIMRDDLQNALRNLQYTLELRVGEAVAAPVDPPQHDDVFIEEVPGLLTQIFGGTRTVRRVRR